MRPPRFFSCVFFFLLSSHAYSTHLRAAEITVRPVDCNSYSYEITIIGYTSASLVLFGGDNSLLDYGDGEKHPIPPVGSVVIDGYNNVGRAIYKVVHTFPGPGRYTISYKEFARNEGIVNIDRSIDNALYTETLFVIQAGQCNASPQMMVPPVDRGCTGLAFYHNPGAIDKEGDSLSYELVTPKKELNTPVTNYLFPDNRKYYEVAGLDYNSANEGADGPPTLRIDPATGLLTWDAPGAAGEYAIAIKVIEWKFRTSDGVWYQNGYVIRDMQIIIEHCENQRPLLYTPADICVIAGTFIEFNVPANDPDGDQVLFEVFSELFSLTNNPAERYPQDDIVQATRPPFDTASIRISWQTDCSHVRTQPYQVVFKITDRPPSGPRLVSFKTVSIKVVAPAPEYESVSVNPVSKEVTLRWRESPCENISGYQVWRRVSEYIYDAPECSNGMPHFLRYKLLKEVSPGDQFYIDGDIAIGALYCYRIVALVGSNKTPSRISYDTCIIPKPAEAPVITQVSVARTDASNGEMRLRWTSPFDIDQTQYPPPYQYRVLRATGLSGNGGFEPVSGILVDTTFVDSGLNTVNNPYRYFVELYVPALSSQPVDSSSISSSVYAIAQAYNDRVSITWEANTPWYNYLQQHPFHLVYRGRSLNDDDLILIDSVDVNEYGFQYVDRGTFMNEPLLEGTTYYYKVMTRGGYGNPVIPEPLLNLSQITGGVLIDNTPPCPPWLILAKQDCSTLPCDDIRRYQNALSWSFTTQHCDEVELRFEVYFKEGDEDEFMLLTNLSGTSFTHEHLRSQAKCYRIRAIDPAGNASGFSNVVCADNCAYIAIPNVFTPGNSDGINDSFRAFNRGSGCPQFVKQVNMKILNRWGQEIRMVRNITEENDFIFWDGYTEDGKEASSGVYYYDALVEFEVRDPSLRERRITGWIHLLRD